MKYYTDVQLLGSNILYRGYENGERVQTKIPCTPYLFTKASPKEKTIYTNIHGDPLKRVDFETPRQAKDFVNQYKDVSGFEVAGMTNFVYPWIRDNFPEPLNITQDLLSIANIDIEVESKDGFPDPFEAMHPITAITISHNREKYYVLTLADYNKHSPEVEEESLVKPEDIVVFKFTDERMLLRKFIELWRDLDPDIITGWYINGFDIPYLYNRLRRMISPEFAKKMSPWERVTEREYESHGSKKIEYTLVGIQSACLQELYKKFTYSEQESYSLNYISSEELGQKKLDYSEAESLQNLYEINPQKYVNYNIRDVKLVEMLDEKKGLIQLSVIIMYDSLVNLKDIFGTVKLWDVLIHNELLDQNVVVPITKPGIRENFAGAYVKDPNPGMHHWVASFDLNSLYPSIILQYNISPETFKGQLHSDQINVDNILSETVDPEIINSLKENNLSVTANGALWDRSKKGFITSIVERIYRERTEYKKKMIAAQQEKEKYDDEDCPKEIENKIDIYNNLQMARKIQLNSLYGAMANPYFRFFDRRFAEGITLTGQLTIKWAEKYLNAWLRSVLKDDNDHVCYIDTDSVYLELSSIVNKYTENKFNTEKTVEFIDKICQNKIEPIIERIYANLASYLNVYENKMVMKREAIANKGIWTAKKRYILNVHNNEGVSYSEPKLKMMGIEAIRSNTPQVCREKIKDGLKVIMSKDEAALQEFINEFKTEFFKLDFADIAKPTSVSEIDKFVDKKSIYRKATPAHVKSAILYNKMIHDLNLTRKYDTIKNGDKIKWVYLKLPNPVKDKVIAAPNFLPKEFNLNEYIDYNKMFEDTFLHPLGRIVELIGWETEKRSSLSGFF